MSELKQIESFQVDHTKLLRGIYVSRKDTTPSGDVLTSFDIRMREPNRQPVMSVSSMHTNEHLWATFLRSHPDWASRTIYYGPMGCRTGVYIVLSGDLSSDDIKEVVTDMYRFMIDFDPEDKIPWASAIECGNWTDHDLQQCRADAQLYYDEILTDLQPENLNYPE